MRRRSLLAFVLALACVGLVRAASVDGRWEGSVQSPNGDFPLTFTFKADGEALTGSVESAMGKVDISEGTIKGDDLAFSVALQDGSKITHEGKLSGDTIAMKSHGPWGDAEFTLKRAASESAGSSGDKKP